MRKNGTKPDGGKTPETAASPAKERSAEIFPEKRLTLKTVDGQPRVRPEVLARLVAARELVYEKISGKAGAAVDVITDTMEDKRLHPKLRLSAAAKIVDLTIPRGDAIAVNVQVNNALPYVPKLDLGETQSEPEPVTVEAEVVPQVEEPVVLAGVERAHPRLEVWGRKTQAATSVGPPIDDPANVSIVPFPK